MAINFYDEAKKLLSKIINKEIEIEIPKDSSLGDYAFACYILSKEMKKSPNEIAIELQAKLEKELENNLYFSNVKAIGPYVNLFVNDEIFFNNVLNKINNWDLFKIKEKKRILVESPAPNTNKPLHLGHIRNGLIGNTIINLLKKKGNQVFHVDLVNDRGIHICKSMLAYKKFGKNETPKSLGMKGDHFVGKYYVKYSQELEKNNSLEDEAKEMLLKWENGDDETLELWKRMNSWALSGIFETYKKINLNVDKTYYESETYLEGKEIILNALKNRIFFKRKDGAIIVDLKDKKLDEKVLLRDDGTSVYITQDISMAKRRYDDFKMDGMIYVVGNEQIYHFNVLFEIFKKLKFKFAENCYHLAYGMIELPSGKMKSREGKIVDADDLIDNMVSLAKKEITKRYDNLSVDEIEKRSKIIGMGALKFFILKYDAMNDFVFNPEDSLSFEGETGPYVQYSYARISSILRKYNELYGPINLNEVDFSNLKNEKNLIFLLSKYEGVVENASLNYKPHLITRYLIDLSQSFNEFYHQSQILKADKKLRDSRIFLITLVQKVIFDGLEILGINVLERM